MKFTVFCGVNYPGKLPRDFPELKFTPPIFPSKGDEIKNLWRVPEGRFWVSTRSPVFAIGPGPSPGPLTLTHLIFGFGFATCLCVSLFYLPDARC